MRAHINHRRRGRRHRLQDTTAAHGGHPLSTDSGNAGSRASARLADVHYLKPQHLADPPGWTLVALDDDAPWP